jgi:hypothetical protein
VNRFIEPSCRSVFTPDTTDDRIQTRTRAPTDVRAQTIRHTPPSTLDLFDLSLLERKANPTQSRRSRKMSSPTPYRPKYPQPFSLREAIDLDVPILSNGKSPLFPPSLASSNEPTDLLPGPQLGTEIQRITHSIQKLLESNREIGRFITDLDDPSEADEFRAVVRENEQTM